VPPLGTARRPADGSATDAWHDHHARRVAAPPSAGRPAAPRRPSAADGRAGTTAGWQCARSAAARAALPPKRS